MDSYIRLEYTGHKNARQFNVYYSNGVLLGLIADGDDGYLQFWPESRGGYWSSHWMREIANILDDLNSEQMRGAIPCL